MSGGLMKMAVFESFITKTQLQLSKKWLECNFIIIESFKQFHWQCGVSERHVMNGCDEVNFFSSKKKVMNRCGRPKSILSCSNQPFWFVD